MTKLHEILRSKKTSRKCVDNGRMGGWMELWQEWSLGVSDILLGWSQRCQVQAVVWSVLLPVLGPVGSLRKADTSKPARHTSGFSAVLPLHCFPRTQRLSKTYFFTLPRASARSPKLEKMNHWMLFRLLMGNIWKQEKLPSFKNVFGSSFSWTNGVSFLRKSPCNI